MKSDGQINDDIHKIFGGEYWWFESVPVTDDLSIILDGQFTLKQLKSFVEYLEGLREPI